MSRAKNYLATMPRKALAVFLLGVFFLFAIFAVAGDITGMGSQSTLRLAVSIIIASTFAVGYAIVGFALRKDFWKAAIPLFVVHFFVMNLVGRWLPGVPAPRTVDAAALARMHSRLNWDALIIAAAMALGYVCFLYASITEGRRYFRVHAEIVLAKEIHQVLVPAIDMKLGGFEFYGRTAASGEVGGDLIDVAGTETNWVAYVVDVSGHGVAPGVVMGMAKSAARMLLSSGGGSERLMARLNEVLYPLKKPDMFATFCFLARDGAGLRAGLGGHPAILRFCAQTGAVERLECANLPLGILPEAEFATTEVRAGRGDVFALYTDGLLETANVKGEEFGGARLEEELRKHGREPLETICRAIQESVARHGVQFDDQSLLLVRQL